MIGVFGPWKNQGAPCLPQQEIQDPRNPSLSLGMYSGLAGFSIMEVVPESCLKGLTVNLTFYRTSQSSCGNLAGW